MSAIHGMLVLDKEEGMTSLVAVKRVQRLFGADKAGHTGTLDPMATGVLPVLLGSATGAASYLVETRKHYRATLRLGVVTDTEDTTGTILKTSDDIPDEDAVRATIGCFIGDVEQVPPMYSAVSVGGVRLHKLARQGKVIDRPARTVTIESIDVRRLSRECYSLDVVCSKGTYIRTLCADIGARLGCGGAMESLRRMETAGCAIADAHTLTEIAEMSEEERMALLCPTRRLFDGLPVVTPSPFFERLALCGAELYQAKIGTSYPTGTRVILSFSTGDFALAEARDFEGGSALKPIKQFHS